MYNQTIVCSVWDFRVEASNTGYTSLVNDTTGDILQLSPSIHAVQHGYFDPNYFIARAYLPFETSNVTESSLVGSASLYMYKGYSQYFSNGDNDTICIVQTFQDNLSIGSLDDYNNVNTTSGGSLNATSDFPNGWFSIDFNKTGLSWINTTGYTKIGLLWEKNINQTPPTTNNFLQFNSATYNHPPYLFLGLTETFYSEATVNLSSIITSYVKLNDAFLEDTTLNLATNVSSETYILRVESETLNLTVSVSGECLRSLEGTLNLTTQLSSQFKYDLDYQLNLTSKISSYEEATYVIPDEPLLIPPKFKLLGYRVIQEFGAPYYVAEVKFQGNDIPPTDEYIEITQTDAETKQVKTIFRGFPISVKWKLKKGLTEATVTAVTNGWYLTQQCPPAVYCSCPQFEYHDYRGYSYVDYSYYPRMNEVMLLWDWLNFIPSEHSFQDDYCGVIRRSRGFNSWYGTGSMGIAHDWYDVAGVAPSPELESEIYDLANTYMPGREWSDYVPIPDALGNTDGPLPGTFNDMTESKWDAIMKMADWSDHVVHMRIAQSDVDIEGYEKGTLVLYWTDSTLANAIDRLEPFNVLLDIDASTDNTFIEATEDEGKTARSIPNLVEVRSQVQQDFAFDPQYNYGYYPCEWWQRVRGEIECGAYWWEHQRPVIHYKTVPELNNAATKTYAEEFYERIQEGEDKYSATFLSSVCERTPDYDEHYRCILPGSRIQITNVSGHDDSEMRITKIIHSKDGAKAPTTQIEYCKVYDLAHPNIKESGIMNKILADFERKAIRGTREETYQNVYNPRKRGIGSPVYAEVGIVENVSSDLNLANVRLVNTSTLLTKVIAF